MRAVPRRAGLPGGRIAGALVLAFALLLGGCGRPGAPPAHASTAGASAGGRSGQGTGRADGCREGAERLQLVGLHRPDRSCRRSRRNTASRSTTTCSTRTRCSRPSCSPARTGYDVVVPSASFLQRQIQAGVFQQARQVAAAEPEEPRSSDHASHRGQRSGQPVRGQLSVGYLRHRLQRGQGRRRDGQRAGRQFRDGLRSDRDPPLQGLRRLDPGCA